MEKEDFFFNCFQSNPLHLVITDDKKVKTVILTNFLYKFCIYDSKEVLMYCYENSCDYYCKHLLSRISGIDWHLITKYMYPWLGISHYDLKEIDRDCFVDAIEKIQSSHLYMISRQDTWTDDFLNPILEMCEMDTSEVVIIEDFDFLLEKTGRSRDEIFQKLWELSNRYLIQFVLFCSAHIKSIEEVDPDLLISNVWVINDIGRTSQKAEEGRFQLMRYECSQKRESWILDYNCHTYEIEKVEVKPDGTLG